MGILLDILALPLTGPINGTMWIAEKLLEQAENEMYDEGKVRAKLMEMEMLLDLGDISEEAYMAAEEELLERMREIRAHNAARAAESQ
ncbi:gas vesicle protein GvpG [Chloroflexales bacterium ZM16-3]|nr:gas vesicle protein GvpG [Chloroflexales bacterium ZM16-3]